jgi:hypothetical protein
VHVRPQPPAQTQRARDRWHRFPCGRGRPDDRRDGQQGPLPEYGGLVPRPVTSGQHRHDQARAGRHQQGQYRLQGCGLAGLPHCAARDGPRSPCPGLLLGSTWAGSRAPLVRDAETECRRVHGHGARRFPCWRFVAGSREGGLPNRSLLGSRAAAYQTLSSALEGGQFVSGPRCDPAPPRPQRRQTYRRRDRLGGWCLEPRSEEPGFGQGSMSGGEHRQKMVANQGGRRRSGT